MPVATVRKGVYELEVGGPAGMIVSRREEPAEAEAPDRPGHVEQVENVVDRASGVTAKVERGKALFEDLADGKLEPAQIANSVDSLVGLLEKLDRKGKHEDALRVARVLSKLLTLARRWADLLKALRAAERIGRLLGDDQIIAWAQHEIGTAQLVEGDTENATQNLNRARKARKRLRDRPGQAATERNLRVLAKLVPTRGRMLRERWPSIRRLLPSVGAGVLLFGIGMAGGAAVAGPSGDGGATTTTDTQTGTTVKTATDTETGSTVQIGTATETDTATTTKTDTETRTETETETETDTTTETETITETTTVTAIEKPHSQGG